MFRNNLAGQVNLVNMALTGHNIYLKIFFFTFTSNLAKFQKKIFFQMIMLAVLSENTVQRPKTLFLYLLYIYTFQLQVFDFMFNGLI